MKHFASLFPRISRIAGIALCALSAIALLLSACSQGKGASQADCIPADSISVAPAAEINDEAWRWADSVMETLTRRALVGQLYMPAAYARADAASMGRILDYADSLCVGGIVLLKGDCRSAARIADTLALRSAPGLFIAIDAENGLRMRLRDAPEFPWSRELGHLDDDQLLYECGREIARECRTLGINMVLGPVVDIVPGSEGGLHSVIGRRSLGSDPRHVADLAVAYARGLEDGNVISVAKHFPGHGSARADSHKTLAHIRSDQARIDSIDLYPFRRYAEELLSGVMVGHLAVPALDSVVRPAVVSPVVMQDILRSRIGFGGLVLTDALNMEGAMGVSGWQAIKAGADIIVAPTDTRREIEKTLQALEDGRLSEETLQHRVRRVLFYKYLLGLDSHTRLDPDKAAILLHREAAALRDTLQGALSRRRALN